MSTDFNYNNKAIAASGPFKLTLTDTPLDSRTRVESVSEISKISNPYVGMCIYVEVSEANNNKPQIYVVTSLKSSELGVANAAIDKYVTLEEFLNLTSILDTTTAKVDSATYEGTTLSIKSGNTELASVDIGNKLVILTQEEYDNLEVKEDSVAYIISDQDSYVKELTPSTNLLRLTTNDVQAAVISSNTTIIVPAVTGYAKFDLYLTLSAAATVTLPTAKVTSTVDFTTGKVYKLTFITLNGTDWLIEPKIFS